MRFLISDYSSPITTEPLYLNTTLNIVGCSSTLWDHNSVSSYDMFDLSKPDIHISHVNFLTNDTVSYLKENKNIEFILNITNIKDDDLAKLDSVIKYNEINLKFYFTNNPNHKLKSRYNILPLSNGADIYFNNTGFDYSIENGIFINHKNQIKPVGETYHYISVGVEKMEGADITLPIINMSAIYKNYKNIVIKYYDNYLNQLFFDAGYYGNNVYLDVADRTKLKNDLHRLFGSDSYCDLSDTSSGDIKQLIKNKHTCLHRTKSLLSQLSAKEYIDKLSTMIEEKTK